ncbi:MAG: hypothetical protein C4K60_03065 [Ideonella sp. MAG2]|nr:MAG: hypothetical protein C4K60_03065 [Ideonella sp. MAG2]
MNNATDAAVNMQSLTIVLLVVDTIIYLIFSWFANLLARFLPGFKLSKRVVGSLAVVLFSAFLAWYLVHHFATEQRLATLSPFRQGEYVGQLVGIPIFPAIVVIAVAAIRGWLQRRDREPGGQGH